MSTLNKTRKRITQTVNRANERISNVASNLNQASQIPIAQRIQNANKILSDNRDISKEVLDRSVKQAADAIRKYSKVVAILSADPAVQKEFAETVVKVGDAVAALSLNYGEFLADFAEKMGPAVKTFMMAGSDMVQDTIFNSAMGVVGAIPIVGDIVSTAGQEFNSTNKNFWKTYWAWMNTVPELIAIMNKGVDGIDQNMDVIRSAQTQTNNLISAVDNISNSIDDNKIAATRAVSPPVITTRPLSARMPIATPARMPIATPARMPIRPNMVANAPLRQTRKGGGRFRKRRSKYKKKTKKRVKKSTKKKALKKRH
jgi:hypothetical protein